MKATVTRARRVNWHHSDPASIRALAARGTAVLIGRGEVELVASSLRPEAPGFRVAVPALLFASGESATMGERFVLFFDPASGDVVITEVTP